MDKTILLDFKTIRKCSVCHSYITLEKELESNSVLWYGTTLKNKTIQHKQCLKKKMLSKKGNKLSEGDADILLDDLFKDGVGHLERLVYKNHLYLYLMKKYDIITLPNYIFTKMELVFNGKFKTMNKPVPPEHLLDMWQRKQSFLDGLYHKEKIDGVGRINYDLAVLIAKYPGYLDWLGKKESDKKMIEEKSLEDKVKIEYFSSFKNDIKAEEKEEDLFSDIDY